MHFKDVRNASSLRSIKKKHSKTDQFFKYLKILPPNAFEIIQKVRQQRFFEAIILNNTEVVIALLEKGMDPNIVSIEGHTPLYMAIDKHYVEMIKILLNYGASVTTSDKDKSNLTSLTKYSHIEILMDTSSQVSSENFTIQPPLQMLQEHLKMLSINSTTKRSF